MGEGPIEQRSEQPAQRAAAEHIAEARAGRTHRTAQRDARIKIRRRDADARGVGGEAALGGANVGTALQQRRPITDRDGIGDFEADVRSEEHTSELQSLMRISYAVFCLKKKTQKKFTQTTNKPIILTTYN